MSLTADQYTGKACQEILQEAVLLLEVLRQTSGETDRLNFLLAEHIGRNDFRSYCFGHDGAQVSLELLILMSSSIHRLECASHRRC
jgi:hypothetical protein